MKADISTLHKADILILQRHLARFALTVPLRGLKMIVLLSSFLKESSAHAPFLRCGSVFHQSACECRSCSESRCCSHPSHRGHCSEISLANPSQSNGRRCAGYPAQRNCPASKNVGYCRLCRRSRRHGISRLSGGSPSSEKRGNCPF